MKAAVCVAILITALSPPVWAQAVEPQGTSSKIMALEKAWGQAIQTKDLKQLDGILDDAFVYVDSGGQLKTKAEVMAFLHTSTVEQMTLEAMMVRVHGATAIVTGTYRLKGLSGEARFRERGRFVDTWILKDGHWLCVVSQTTAMSQ